MGNKEKQQIKNLKQTMKFASIIAIAAVLSFSAEAQGNGNGNGNGNGGGRGGRGGRSRIPRRFRNSDGALVGCRVREEGSPIGGGFMHQNEGEDTFIRTCWKDLEFWDGSDDEDFDPRTIDVDVYSSNDVSDRMQATAVHTAIGSFNARDSGKGRFVDREKAGVMLTGDNSVLGHYLSISVDGEIIQCCELADLRENDDDDSDGSDINQN